MNFLLVRAGLRSGVNRHPEETASGGSAAMARQFADVVVAGRRPNVAVIFWQILVAVILYLAIAPLVIKIDAKFLPIVLILLLAAGVRARFKAFTRPPRATIEAGEFSLRLFPNLTFKTPATNVANIDLRAGRMIVTFRDTHAVNPVKWRPWLNECFRKQGCHATAARDVFSLEQVNRLRTTLGMPPQGADLSVDFVQAFERTTPRVVVTPALIAANAIVFLVTAALGAGLFMPDGRLMIHYGANFGPLTRDGQWWRLLSSIFLHFGVLHLLMNMYVLWVVGPIVERWLGPVGFAIGYIVSGFFGSVASAYWHDAIVSVGASGAVFGVFGMLPGLVTGRQQSLPMAIIKQHRALALKFLVLNLALGFGITEIDLAAHLGGLAAGFLFRLVLRGNLPIGAGRRTSRNLILAATASVVGAMAIHFLSTRPPDILTICIRADAVDSTARTLFATAIRRQESGVQASAETSAEIRKSILPMYVDLAGQLERVPRRNEKERDRMKSTMVEYVQLKREAWELLGDAFEHDDVVSRGLATLRFEEAQRLHASQNPAANNQQSRVPTDFHTEFAVLAVAEAQARQAQAALHELISQGQLAGAEAAAAFERDVLAVWQAGVKRFLTAARGFPAEDQQLAARTRKYIDLRSAGLQLLAQSLRDGDQTKAAAGHKKLDESAEAAKEIWPKSPDADAVDQPK